MGRNNNRSTPPDPRDHDAYQEWEIYEDIRRRKDYTDSLALDEDASDADIEWETQMRYEDGYEDDIEDDF
ncbi:hypothetical protein [Paenibacillus gallinarum]|uniref:Uncharacterized protein n=1 Tax=Paenibacillus gallinarum TaxID=2762232 RepID=A0ABR8T3I6_9BACL|nr:hypothetical protein [Paenibacillus gallinarum]MBD7970340.1 hypothetical protein [Paenibacillus gallinarum]